MQRLEGEREFDKFKQEGVKLVHHEWGEGGLTARLIVGVVHQALILTPGMM